MGKRRRFRVYRDGAGEMSVRWRLAGLVWAHHPWSTAKLKKKELERRLGRGRGPCKGSGEGELDHDSH